MFKNSRYTQLGFSKVWIALIIFLVAASIGAGATYAHFRVPVATSKDANAKFVTASPVDFEQMEFLSKFRSCSGHDYSGKDIQGTTEHERSMKNYAIPLAELYGKKNKVKVFAPFDAEVINNVPAKSIGDNFDLVPTKVKNWVFEIGHIDALDNLKVGTKVKAGDLVGYSDGGQPFDLQFWFGKKDTVNTLNGQLDSLFSHMTPELTKKLSKYGITPANLVTSKQYRDDHPCTVTGKKIGSSIFKSDFATDQYVIPNAVHKTRAVNENPNASFDTPPAANGPANTANGGKDVSAECALPVGQRPPGCK